LDPGKGKSALSKAERQEDEVNLLLGSFAVIRPELPRFVHVLADDSTLRIALPSLATKSIPSHRPFPASSIDFYIIIIIFCLEKTYFLRFRSLTIDPGESIRILPINVKWPTKYQRLLMMK
jgi:hypothetical protein